jgi:hypothetical protein
LDSVFFFFFVPEQTAAGSHAAFAWHAYGLAFAWFFFFPLLSCNHITHSAAGGTS